MPDFALSQEVLAEAQAAEQALAAAKAYNVATADDYSSAGEELKSLTARARRLEDMRVNLKAPALEQCRRIDEFFRAPQQFIEDAKMAIKRALGVYDTQQRKLREEAERKAEEIARRERERLRAEAAAIEEMVFKEERILLPMALQNLTETEWGEIFTQSPQFGYCLVDPRDGYRPPAAASGPPPPARRRRRCDARRPRCRLRDP